MKTLIALMSICLSGCVTFPLTPIQWGEVAAGAAAVQSLSGTAVNLKELAKDAESK